MENKENTQKTMRSVFVALFAALISAGAFIAVPIGPIPIVIQNMLIILAGALLGGAQGGGAVGLFLTAGALGLPVFSGGRGGLASLMGPTGGFLIGYFIAALVTGFYIGRPSTEKKTSVARIAVGCLLGYAVVYVPGILWMQSSLNLSLIQAIASGLTPFLLGDAIKLVITVLLAIQLRPFIARYIFSS